MRRLVVLSFILLAFASIQFAQTAAPAAKKPAAKSASSATAKTPAKPASKAVVTIEHLCPAGSASKQAFAPTCKTEITEAEIEKAITAVNPDIPRPAPRSAGMQLGELTAYAAKAHELGIDKSPEFLEALKILRLQAAAQMMFRHMQKEASNIPDAELKSYYDSHKDAYETFTLQRIIVPRETAKEKVDEAAEKQFAQQIRDRWSKGEDAKALQGEAYKHANQTAPEPPVDLGPRRRGSLPPSQAKVFDLKAGEISEVLPDSSAFFIYKVASRDAEPFEKTSAEIKRNLVGERMKAAKQKMDSQFNIVLDDSYFGPAAQRPQPGAPTLKPQGAVTPVAPGTTPGGRMTTEQVQEMQKRMQQSAPQPAAPASTPAAQAPSTTQVPK